MVNTKFSVAILIACCLAIVPSALFAQGARNSKFSAKNWQLTDFATDSVFGTGVSKAYAELLKGKKSQQVIVAVIDAGLDTAHEDLQGHVWTNKKEIAGNNIDDDNNGYTDDIHGWNFIGGKNGRNIDAESLEAAREYYRLHSIYGDINDSNKVAQNKRADYRYWLKLKNSHLQDSAKSASSILFFTSIVSKSDSIISIWKPILNKDSISLADIKTGTAPDATADSLRSFMANFYGRNRLPADMPLLNISQLTKGMISRQTNTLTTLNADPNAQRREIVGDDPDDINDRNYGNNNVNAGVPTHGTHVAGIIAASRNNNIGMDGIADNVLIMPVRAAPDGDERDKDVALAIRYAVDNGARIINMSFGKPYSPGKKWVDDAVKYAETKDVLLVHAAGNEGQDIDTTDGFPTPVFLGTSAKASNFITVGASAGGPDSLLAASFSNYGHSLVDLFAPGVNIYSTIPGSKYAALSGTSMASPVVAGIAALVLEYYPSLSAKQLKYVLGNSVSKYPGDLVSNPGTRKKADFSTLSATGGIINAYNALKLAATLKGEHKK